MRSMDEIFQIEKCVGEIAGVISLQFKLESIEFKCEEFEQFAEPVKEEKPAATEENPDEPVEQPPAEEGGDEEKKPAFNPADYKWTITNKNAKNLPQLFNDFKGGNCVLEEKASGSFDDVAQEAVSKSLDEFCARVAADGGSKYIY